MPLELLARLGKEAVPMLVREDHSMNKVLTLQAAGLVRALQSEDQDEMLVSLTDEGRRALAHEPASPPSRGQPTRL